MDRIIGKLGNFYLRNELYDLDKDIKWRIPGDNSFSPLRKQGVDNGLQAALCHIVRFAFDPENVIIRTFSILSMFYNDVLLFYGSIVN